MILAQVCNEEAFRSTVESLRWIYTIVFALAIGEAFKQVVVNNPQERKIQWDRLLALLCLLAMVVPFYQGMSRYLFETYLTTDGRPPLDGLSLLLDCLVFTIEGALFFILSRSLPLSDWRLFHRTIPALLVVDMAWVAVTQMPILIQSWFIVNVICLPMLLANVFFPHKLKWTGPIVATLLVVARTFFDYWLTWDFYFPPS